MPASLDSIQSFFDQHRKDFTTLAPGLDSWRVEHFEQFKQAGFPSRKQEAWRYMQLPDRSLNAPFCLSTEVEAVYLQPIQRCIASWVQQAKAWAVTPYVKVFVEGRACDSAFYPPDYCDQALPEGVIMTSISSALQRYPDQVKAYLTQQRNHHQNAKKDNTMDYPFCALNSALMTDGLFLYVPQGVRLTQPIYLLHLTTASGCNQPVDGNGLLMNTLQHCVVAEQGAQANLFEVYQSLALDDKETGAAALKSAPYFSNVRLRVCLGAGASIQRHKLQNEAEEALHVSHTELDLAEESCFDSYYYQLGAQYCREEVCARLNTKSRCSLKGVSALNQRQQLDTHLLLEHVGAESDSLQLYKNLIGGSATATLTGKIMVHPKAPKVKADQTNKNLLISDAASANTRPSLEIYTDDVQCNHGATVGQIDADQLFYLRSRGIPEPVARLLLMQGFLNDILSTVALASVQAAVKTKLFEKLDQLDLFEVTQ